MSILLLDNNKSDHRLHLFLRGGAAGLRHPSLERRLNWLLSGSVPPSVHSVAVVNGSDY